MKASSESSMLWSRVVIDYMQGLDMGKGIISIPRQSMTHSNMIPLARSNLYL